MAFTQDTELFIGPTDITDRDKSFGEYIQELNEENKEEYSTKNKGINKEERKVYKNKVWQREYKIGRNDKCPCGSGKKYKKCCLNSGKYEMYKEKI